MAEKAKVERAVEDKATGNVREELLPLLKERLRKLRKGNPAYLLGQNGIQGAI